MLDFGIVDTHVHLWDVGRLRYPWLDDIPLLNRPYLPADFRAAHGPIPVDKIVFLQAEVEPAQFLDEAQWVASLVDEEPRLVGIVPWAPLEDGDRAADALDRLAEIPQVKGVRRIIQFEPDLGFCLQPDFVRGVRLLERYGFSFDICISHVQLANTIELVRQCPNIPFVLDHIGKPDIAAGQMEPWKSELSELAPDSKRTLQAVGHGHRGRPPGVDSGRPDAIHRSRGRELRLRPRDVRGATGRSC